MFLDASIFIGALQSSDRVILKLDRLLKLVVEGRLYYLVTIFSHPTFASRTILNGNGL